MITRCFSTTYSLDVAQRPYPHGYVVAASHSLQFKPSSMPPPPAATEAFPPLTPTFTPHPEGLHSAPARRPSNRRRKSSNLGADPRGDTGATAFATRNLPVLHTQSPPSTPTNQKPTRPSKRRKAKSLLNRCKRMCLKHTWIIPLALVVTILALYFVSPGEHNPLHYAIFLSYANPPLNERTHTLPAHIGNVTQYGKGPKDLAFVAFYMIVLSFTREFLMQRLIRPIAIRCGIRARGKQSRFMEQFYTAMYFAVFGPFGMYVMSRTPVWYFNTAGMYEGFPHRAHEAVFKAYYLLQASYWAQQSLVMMLMLEKPRKDFKELVLHHIITLALIGLSYRFHFTYIGVAVYITHDISDFFLAVSGVLALYKSVLTKTRPLNASIISTRGSHLDTSASSSRFGHTSATTSTLSYSLHCFPMASSRLLDRTT